MAKLQWDEAGKRLYETGVEKCVLFVYDSSGATPGYKTGVPWNGLTNVSEKPTGAETTSLYANDSKYINLVSIEQMEASMEAYTYPDEFAECDGSAELVAGATIGQQPRKTFGLCYRTKVGNDVDGEEHGYKLHFIYGATASPSEKSYATVNDSPEAITFSWEMKTTPVNVDNAKPTASVVVDSTKFTSETQKAKLNALCDYVYGKDGSPGEESKLPMPDKIKELLTVTASESNSNPVQPQSANNNKPRK